MSSTSTSALSARTVATELEPTGGKVTTGAPRPASARDATDADVAGPGADISNFGFGNAGGSGGGKDGSGGAGLTYDW